MGFEDLEARLRFVLKSAEKKADASTKARVSDLVQARFKAKSRANKWLKWRIYFARTLSLSTMAALLLGTTGVVDMPLLSNQVVGQIESQGGVVEIIRGDESLLVSGSEALRQGDWVRVGHRGQATITTDHFASEVEAGSWLKLERSNTVFLDKGRLSNTSHNAAQIKTNRGLVKSGGGDAVAIEVLETGETHVLPETQQVAVFDLNNGQILARAGERVILRSDTILKRSEGSPTDLGLSNAQIESVLGKLAITRTKALTGIENVLAGKRDQGHKEIMSAEQSFKSVAQVLGNGRDMRLSHRVNLDSVAVSDIHSLLKTKTARADLLTESYALEQLFAVLAQNRNSLAFAPIDTGVEAYDRYVLLHNLASVATVNQAAAMQTLADNYVISVLRKVQSSPIKIEQLAFLNTQIDALPLNAQSEQFLTALKNRLSPDLSLALEEKMNYLF